MIATPDNAHQNSGKKFGEHMAELERLRKLLERGELDPVEALAACKEAEGHYRAVDAILTRVEREIEQMQAAAS